MEEYEQSSSKSVTFITKNEMLLRSGAKFVVEVSETGDGEFIKSYVMGQNGILGEVTCNCTCSGGASTSKTCTTNQGPTFCDCSDRNNPRIVC